MFKTSYDKYNFILIICQSYNSLEQKCGGKNMAYVKKGTVMASRCHIKTCKIKQQLSISITREPNSRCVQTATENLRERLYGIKRNRTEYYYSFSSVILTQMSIVSVRERPWESI